jgi:octaprenyl-diphosphate synthase
MTVTGFFGNIESALQGFQIDPASLVDTAEFIAQVEGELKQQVSSQIELVEGVGRITLEGGGKRLRPALVFLAATATGKPFQIDRAIKLGTAMELIHMATLIHDDVIDDATLRRGKPTAFSQYGITPSILGGDVLLAKAMQILAEDGDLNIIRTVSQAVVELAEGEVEEIALRGQLDLSIDSHLRVLRMKTASFIECCCRVGALLADAPTNQLHALCQYGHHLGMAFQIVDDVLDFRGEPSTTGKPRATDFREGQATLPLLYLLPELNADEQQFIGTKFGNGSTDAEIEQIITWMEERNALAQADQDAREHASAARQSLKLLPVTDQKILLSAVAQGVTNRKA